MLQSVKYCHEHQIIHGNIKLENFITNIDFIKGSITVKLIDFGRASHYDPTNPQMRIKGNIRTMAPEIISQK